MAINDNNAYGAYIASVRRKTGLNEAKFAEKVYHFSKNRCLSFGRTSVINWEHSKSLPKTKESFLCIALLDFCGDIEKNKSLSIEERNERLGFVNEKMKQYLGVGLYSRNITESLLIQVARGIFSITEVLHIKEKVYSRKTRCKALTSSQTHRMMQELCAINKPSDMEAMVTRNEDYYSAGYKALGARLKELCEEVHPERSFLMSVCMYAPQYHSSHQRLTKDDISVSREYLVTVCYQLGFSAEQTNKILASAQMKPLDLDEFPNSRFRFVEKMSIARKFCYLIYLMRYFKEEVVCENLPYYFYLEGYLILHATETEFVKMEKLIRDNMEDLIDNFEENTEEGVKKLRKSINAFEEVVSRCSQEEKEEYEEFCGGYKNLYYLPRERTKDMDEYQIADLEAMYRVATFSYMLLLEKEYAGELTTGDLQQLARLIEKKPVYLFLNNFWTLFLDAGKFMMDENGRVYGMRGEPLKKTEYYEWSELLENMAECCWTYLNRE